MEVSAPRHRTGLLWIISCVIHFAGAIVYAFLVPPLHGGMPEDEARVLSILQMVAVVLILGTPAFGYVWSRLYMRWHDKRHPPDHCQKCGYDLTGNISGTCPECGTDAPRAV